MIVIMDHLAAYNTERNRGLFITDESVEDEGTPRYNFRVTGELGESFEGHLWTLFYSVARGDSEGRVVHELVEMGEILG